MSNKFTNGTFMDYKGHVSVKLRIKDKIVDLEAHNAGLPSLKRSFAKFITGNYGGDMDIPQYIDIRTISGEIPEESETSWSLWSPCLITRSSISDRFFSSLDGIDYIATLGTTITHDELLEDIASESNNHYRIYLCGAEDETYTEEKYKYSYFAYLDVQASDLAKIQPGTVAIIEWTMQLKNSSEE